MIDILVHIRKICTKYNMSVSARMCYALIVEYYLCNGKKDDIREVLEENVEYFPLDIIPATDEIVEYLKQLNLPLVDYNYSDVERGSWQKFDIGGEEWYIIFTLVDGRRSDFENGWFSGAKELDKQEEMR